MTKLISVSSNKWLPLLCLLMYGYASKASAESRLPIEVLSEPPGAVVFLDTVGKKLGTTPLQGILVEFGEHILIFELAGFESAWMPIFVDQGHRRFEGKLSKSSMLSLTATRAAVLGAEVFIDNQPVGAMPIQRFLDPGRHLLKVSKEGFLDFQRWIEVGVGEQKRVSVDLRPAVQTKGSVLVSADIPGLSVFINGKRVGKLPVVVDDLEEGQHELGIEFENGLKYEQMVKVTANERKAINLNLSKYLSGESVRSRILVRASVEQARVLVDGVDHGRPPVALYDLKPGKHEIMVRAKGYRPYFTTCVIPEEDCDIQAVLDPVDVSVRVISNVADAELFVDGKRAGSVPFYGSFRVGKHLFEVRSSGYETFKKTLRLRDPEKEVLVDAPLEQDSLFAPSFGPVASEQARTEATLHAANVLPEDVPVVELFAAWPYLAGFRAATATLDWLQLGFQAQSFVRITDFVGEVKAGWLVGDRFAFGTRTRFGGGIGPDRSSTNVSTGARTTHPVNSFHVQLDGLGSIRFGRAGVLTLQVGAQAVSDRYDFAEKDGDTLVVPAAELTRQEGIRFIIGGHFDLIVSRYWNIFIGVNGVVADGMGGRRLFGDLFGLGNADSRLYTEVGVTYKF